MSNPHDAMQPPSIPDAAKPNRGLILMIGATSGEVLYFAYVISVAKAAGVALGEAVAAIGAAGVVAAGIIGFGIAAFVVYVLPPQAAKPAAKAAAVIGGAAAGAAIGAAVGGPVGAVVGGIVGGIAGWLLS
jgi:hypothetical protein